jgi:hypothetical protein
MWPPFRTRRLSSKCASIRAQNEALPQRSRQQTVIAQHAIHSSITCLAESDANRLEWVFLSRLTGVMMNVLTDDEVHKFLSDNEWHFRISAEGNSLRYPNPEANCIELRFPDSPRGAVYHTWLASRLGIIDHEPQFSGALLWITLSSIGSPGLVQTGWKLIEKMRQGFGENRSLQTASGHVFRSDELVELNAFLLPCYIFGWDAYVVPSNSSDFFVHISHDEYWGVVTRTPESYARRLAELKEINPVDSPAMRKRFCGVGK